MNSMDCIILTFGPMTAVSAATNCRPPGGLEKGSRDLVREVDAQVVPQDVGVVLMIARRSGAFDRTTLAPAQGRRFGARDFERGGVKVVGDD